MTTLKNIFTRILTLMMVFSLVGGSFLSSASSVVLAEDSSSSSSEKTEDDKKEDDKESDDKKDGDKKDKENESGAKSTTSTSSNGSANDRVNAYIDFAAGKTLDAAILGENKKVTLNTTELRFMGIFMSNFYSPWMTDLGSASDKSSENAEKQVAEALTSYVGFDGDTASSFAKYIQGITRASATNLTLKFKKHKNEDHSKARKIKGKVSEVNITYADFLLLVSGFAYDQRDNLKEYVGEGYGDGDYRWGYLGFDGEDGWQPVFEFDTRADEQSASMVAFLKAMEMVDTSKGYGFAALDFKDGEIEITPEQYKTLMESYGPKELQKSSIYGANLAVDAFGNILWLGGQHQYVILPGAMNPFTYQPLDEKGQESKEAGKSGSALPLANAQIMAHIANGSLGNVSGKEGSADLTPNDGGAFKGVGVVQSVDDGTGLAANTVRATGLRVTSKGATSVLKAVIGNSADLNSLDLGQNFLEGLADFGELIGASDGPMEAKLYGVAAADFYLARSFGGMKKVESGKELVEQIYKLSTNPALQRISDFRMPTPKYSNEKIKILSGLALLDTQGSYGSSTDTGDPEEDSFGKTDDADGGYALVQKGSFLKEDGSGIADEFGSVKSGDVSAWEEAYSSTQNQSYAKLDSTGTAKAAWKYLYSTYLVAALSEGKFAGGENLGYRINYPDEGKQGVKGLPKITGESIQLSEEERGDAVTKAIRDWLYYLLHPTSGFNYFVTWITNKIKHFLLSWHNDMAGTDGVGVIAGTTRYIGFSGYVTTPELKDMEWTDSMVKWYQSIMIYLVIGIFVIMMAYVLLGLLTVQRALLGVVIFSVLVYAPVVVTSVSVTLGNRFANFVFGDKFSYWGIVQQQAYFADLADSIDTSKSTYQNYLLNLYEQNMKESSNQGGDNIVLRWQAPKKMSSLVMSNKEENFYSDDFTKMIRVVTDGKGGTGESYTGAASAGYMFRSYTDLANMSMYMYGDFVSNGQTRDDVDSNTSATNTGAWSKGLQESWANFTTRYTEDRSSGYGVKDSEGSTDGKQAYRVRLPLAGTIYSDAANVSHQGTLKDLKLGEYTGLDQRFFKFSIAQLNSNQDLIEELKTDKFDPSAGGKYTNADVKSLAAYGVMSENPFYYFSWGLYDQGLASNPSASGGFRDLLLSKSDSGYFYNVEANNEMRDYMDLRSMFTYLIPYLKQGNDLVREWDSTYGVFFHNGVTYEEGHEEDADITANPELAQKYWHNVNVARLYNIYTPWVDLMYDAGYAKPTTISYQGERYQILDPLNPASYPKERPMVFSRSEMYDYGLNESQLTAVERKIMKVSDKTMERWYRLLNYYNFNDAALNTSAAMEAAFVFNTEFSDAKVVGDSINLYPQSFELKNFTYDAFLRMIIASSTGESLIADEGEQGSVYERIMTKSSLTTAILLLILDVIAIYAIPLIKVIILIGLFVSAVIVVIISALTVTDDIGRKTVAKVSKAIVVPAVGFLGTSVAMSWVVSLFMGSGNTSVTGTDGKTIVLGDPAMTILAMTILNIVVFIAYFKVWKKLWSVIKEYGGLVLSQFAGVLTGVGMMGLGALGIGAAAGVGAARLGSDLVRGTAQRASVAGQALTGNVAGAAASAAKYDQENKQRKQRRAVANAERKAKLRAAKKSLRETGEAAQARAKEQRENFKSWVSKNRNGKGNSGNVSSTAGGKTPNPTKRKDVTPLSSKAPLNTKEGTPASKAKPDVSFTAKGAEKKLSSQKESLIKRNPKTSSPLKDIPKPSKDKGTKKPNPFSKK